MTALSRSEKTRLTMMIKISPLLLDSLRSNSITSLSKNSLRNDMTKFTQINAENYSLLWKKKANLLTPMTEMVLLVSSLRILTYICVPPRSQKQKALKLNSFYLTSTKTEPKPSSLDQAAAFQQPQRMLGIIRTARVT